MFSTLSQDSLISCFNGFSNIRALQTLLWDYTVYECTNVDVKITGSTRQHKVTRTCVRQSPVRNENKYFILKVKARNSSALLNSHTGCHLI